jgi:hypothetical protein
MRGCTINNNDNTKMYLKYEQLDSIESEENWF